MFNKFKALLRAAEQIGTVEKMTMYETYASIDLTDENGKKISLTLAIMEERKNDTV